MMGGRIEGRRRWIALVVGLALLALAGAWLWPRVPVLLDLLGDPERLRENVAALGWLGPMALVALNVVQIVIAPIPGYGVYIVAGLLFGTLWGGIWGSTGLLVGGMSAMWLARRLGRPIVERLVGAERLARWEGVVHSESTLVWGLIFLAPVGDAPFLLAGLSRVGYFTILILATLTRVPAAFAAAAIGSGALSLSDRELAIAVVVIAVPVIFYAQFRRRIHRWFERQISARTRASS